MDSSFPKLLRTKVKRVLTCLSPKLETAVNFRYVTGEKLDWNNPKGINAKINWLKVNTYYNNPLITQCADKYGIRTYLSLKKMDDLCPELYGVYENVNELEWSKFPRQFVVKCNHACGTNLIVKDKAQLDIPASERMLDDWMKLDYWKDGEVQYRFIKKKIIVEEYLGDGEDLKTYKFFCFNGEPKVLYLSMDEDEYIDYFDMDFNHLPYTLPPHQHYPYKLDPPATLDEMVRIAKILSADFPFVRVDLYDARGKIYISELTFAPTNGYMKIEPPEVLSIWGDWLDLSNELDALKK